MENKDYKEILVVGINGSPHKNGATAQLLNEVLASSRNAGGKTSLIHLASYEIKPCLGCYSIDSRKCVYPCRIKDGMQELYKILEKTDALVLGSPVYWFNMSGLMKNFIDRLTCAENNNFFYEGKVAAVLASKEDDGGIVATMNMASALNHMGFLLLPYTIYSPGTETGENWATSTANFIGKKLVEVSRVTKEINWEE